MHDIMPRSGDVLARTGEDMIAGMPMYDYRCERCGSQFEVRQSFSDETLTLCPAQGGPTACAAPGEGPVKKVFSGVGISFKGEGFYKNDHGANAAGRKKEREATAPKDSSKDSSSKDSPSTDSSKDSSSKDSSSADGAKPSAGAKSGSDSGRAKADAAASS